MRVREANTKPPPPPLTVPPPLPPLRRPGLFFRTKLEYDIKQKQGCIQLLMYMFFVMLFYMILGMQVMRPYLRPAQRRRGRGKGRGGVRGYTLVLGITHRVTPQLRTAFGTSAAHAGPQKVELDLPPPLSASQDASPNPPDI